MLYEGEASGGKSYGLRWWLIDFLIDAYQTLGLSSVVVGLFSEDYPTLKDRHISKIRVEMPNWLGRLTRTDGGLDFVLRPEYGSGAIALRNLDDPSKYFSAEFAAIAVEELTKHPLSVFNDLRFRLRWPGIERPKFAAGTNPGGVGHSWVKKYWITKEYPPEFKGFDKRTGQPYDITGQFARVTAKASDNPHIPDGYHTRNLTLPPDMARRVAHGDWNIYTGQYFPQFASYHQEQDLITGDWKNVGKQRHIITTDEARALIKPWYTRWISGDWGYDHPHCIHWHAKDEQNRVITYREQWGRHVSETELGQMITRVSAGEKLKAFPFSWDAGKLSPRSAPKFPKSINQMLADAMAGGLPKPHPADSSPGSRMSGYRLMSQLLDADMWLISDACPKLIECLPTLIRDEDDTENVLKVDFAENEIGDDPADSSRVGLQYMLGSALKPKREQIEDKLQEVRRSFAGDGEKPAFGVDPFSKFGGKKL